MRNVVLKLSAAGLLVLVAGCGQVEAVQEASGETAAADTAQAAPETREEPAAPAQAAGTRACMIAGEFEILGRKLRSRDCLQAGNDIPEATHTELCQTLAQTSAQLGGGKAGEITYMDECPSPNQGSCRGIFGQKTMHAFYYERPEDDLATLPDSCRMGGGTWVG